MIDMFFSRQLEKTAVLFRYTKTNWQLTDYNMASGVVLKVRDALPSPDGIQINRKKIQNQN